MGVDHELRQRPVHPRHGAFQHDEPRARSLGRGLEIHAGFDALDLVMLDRFEIKAGLLAPAFHLDIVTFVIALGHIIGGVVGDPGEHIGQLRIQLLRLGVHRGDLCLFVADQRPQALELGLIAAALGGPDFLAGLVLLGLGGFGGGDLGAARGIKGQHRLRHRSLAPAGESGVKSLGIVADGADVVHGFVLKIG